MVFIPEWIKEIRLDGYKNIFEIFPESQRLHGTESFCGDWKAHTIILAKDFAPSKVIYERLNWGWVDPYVHSQKLPTNRTLAKILNQIGVDAPIDGSNAQSCGIIYINAYFLLRDDGMFSGALPHRRDCAGKSRPVFKYALENLPKAERIICMGQDAYDFACDFWGLQEVWRKNLNNRHYVNVDGYKLIASSHLGSRGVTNRLIGHSRAECMNTIIEDWKCAVM